jgi:hypothetical protein
MAPIELARIIASGFKFSINPAGTAAHNSNTPNRNTDKNDKIISIGLIRKPPF